MSLSNKSQPPTPVSSDRLVAMIADIVDYNHAHLSLQDQHDLIHDEGGYLDQPAAEIQRQHDAITQATGGGLDLARAVRLEKTPEEVGRFIYNNLPNDHVEYAVAKERGEYRGFAALHDLCDANMLLVNWVGHDVSSEANQKRANAIMDEVNKLLVPPVDEEVIQAIREEVKKQLLHPTVNADQEEYVRAKIDAHGVPEIKEELAGVIWEEVNDMFLRLQKHLHN